MYPEPKMSDAIRANETYRLMVEKATRALWEAVGEVDDQVEVSWTLGKDYAGHDEFRLTLSDAGGALAVALFTPEDLARDYAMRGRFYRVWGRLLRERTRELLREFNKMITAEGVAT
jgi:hypothetical protein